MCYQEDYFIYLIYQLKAPEASTLHLSACCFAHFVSKLKNVKIFIMTRHLRQKKGIGISMKLP